MDDYKIILIVVATVFAILIAGMVLFNPSKADSNLSFRNPKELTKGYELAVILTDIDSRPIANQNITVRITDSNGTLTQKSVITDSDGMARISLSDFAPGAYRANVTYNESFAFKASKTSQSFTISANASK